MNDRPTTAADLLAAATALFARNGYRGTSVRAITGAAGTNLGAITYHFGSKDALYDAVFASVVEPSVQHLARASSGSGSAVERIERFVRAMFGYLEQRPEFPRLLAQHLAASLPMPDSGRRTMRANIGLLSRLIAEGQREGSIRGGDAFLLALSVGAQPMFLALMRRALWEGAAIDQGDPRTRGHLVESVVRFVRQGLATHPEATEGDDG